MFRRGEVGCDRKATDLLVEGHPLQLAVALKLQFHIPQQLLSSSPVQSLMALLCSFVLFKGDFYLCLYMSLWVGVFLFVFCLGFHRV